jgi:hypothetical protein
MQVVEGYSCNQADQVPSLETVYHIDFVRLTYKKKSKFFQGSSV